MSHFDISAIHKYHLLNDSIASTQHDKEDKNAAFRKRRWRLNKSYILNILVFIFTLLIIFACS